MPGHDVVSPTTSCADRLGHHDERGECGGVQKQGDAVAEQVVEHTSDGRPGEPCHGGQRLLQPDGAADERVPDDPRHERGPRRPGHGLARLQQQDAAEHRRHVGGHHQPERSDDLQRSGPDEQATGVVLVDEAAGDARQREQGQREGDEEQRHQRRLLALGDAQRQHDEGDRVTEERQGTCWEHQPHVPMTPDARIVHAFVKYLLHIL